MKRTLEVGVLPLSHVTQRGRGGHGRAGPDTGLFPADAWVQGSLALSLQQKLNTVSSLDTILGQAGALTF